MPALRNSFLLIGPWNLAFQEIGAVSTSDLSLAQKSHSHSNFEVLALPLTSILEKKFETFHQGLTAINPHLQLVVVVPTDFSSLQLLDLHRKYKFFSVLNSFQEKDVENTLYLALERAQHLRQEQNLELLIQEQNQHLSTLYSELEERVEKRTKFLTEARRKLFVTNSRIESFRRALVAIHEARSIAEIEKFLNDSMNSLMKTTWIRILFSPQDQVFHQQVGNQLQFHQLQIPLFTENQKMGSIFFMRAPDHKFIKEEIDFLTRVSEGVSLALTRLSKLQDLETLKQQWESTFDAMAEPVALIDENYDLVQTNRNFSLEFQRLKKDRNSSSDLSHLSGKRKCFEVLFGRQSPCVSCRRGQNFRVQQKDITYDVSSQKLILDGEKKSVYVHLYNDISEDLKMERQILENARLAELGTISSSIAHELNNPLGGLLTFAQLIKMETPSNTPLFEDIVEIEKGAQRCRDIIQNMLVFTRNPEIDPVQELDLGEVLQRAFRIMELQTKSLGIDIQMIQPVPVPRVVGHRNLLAQAFKSLMQICLDSLRSSSQKDLDKKKIRIEIIHHPEHFEVQLSPFISELQNMNSSQNYSWSLAAQIFKEQNAVLEISSSSSRETFAKISFSRPVLRS